MKSIGLLDNETCEIHEPKILPQHVLLCISHLWFSSRSGRLFCLYVRIFFLRFFFSSSSWSVFIYTWISNFHLLKWSNKNGRLSSLFYISGLKNLACVSFAIRIYRAWQFFFFQLHGYNDTVRHFLNNNGLTRKLNSMRLPDKFLGDEILKFVFPLLF